MEIALKEKIIDNTISLDNYHIKCGAIFYVKANNEFSFSCTLCQKEKCENLEKLRNHLENCSMNPWHTFNFTTNSETITKSTSNEPDNLSNTFLIKDELNEDGIDNNIKCGELYYSKSSKLVTLACTLCITNAFTIFDEFSIHSLTHLQHDVFEGEIKMETESESQIEDLDLVNIVETNNISEGIFCKPQVKDENEKYQMEEIFANWGLSRAIRTILDTYGINKLQHLQVIEAPEIDKFFKNFDSSGFFGDRILFTNGLKKWRREQGIPMSCDQDTVSNSTAKRILELSEQILKHILNSSHSGNLVDHTEELENGVLSPTGDDLQKLLKSTNRGKMIINHYEKFKVLDSKQQKDLSHCIVDRFIGDKMRMNYTDMKNWANAIKQCFPCETVDTYFVERKPGKRNPTGKLHSRWVNSEHEKSQVSEKTKIIKVFCSTDLTPDALLDMKLWLNKNCTPWKTVCDYWNKTTSLRIPQLQEDVGLSLTDLLNDWPRLRDADGYQLIDIDFVNIFPEKQNLLLNKYERFVERALALYDEEIKDKSSKDLLSHAKKADIDKDECSKIQMRIHSGVKPNKCEECLKYFNSPGNLKVHMRRHTGEKPYKCEECLKCYTSHRELKLHMRVHIRETSYKCDDCLKCFRSLLNLKAHMARHTGEKPFKCQQCLKDFARSTSLETHVRIHTGEKPFECEHCLKCFRSLQTLRVHMGIHTGEKLFKCEQCLKDFTSYKNLEIHMRIHTGEKPFNCEDCLKCFRSLKNLKAHMGVHTGEKPYKCNNCSKCFTASSTLKKHMQKHTGK